MPLCNAKSEQQKKLLHVMHTPYLISILMSFFGRKLVRSANLVATFIVSHKHSAF
jgi:hypothetical protein